MIESVTEINHENKRSCRRFRAREKSLDALFHGFDISDKSNESVVFIGPHDDDPALGAGLLIYELKKLGIKVHIAIMTDGSRGYTDKNIRNKVVNIRKAETERAYEILGVKKDEVKRFELPDSDLTKCAYIFETEKGKEDGLIAQLIKYFRKIRATRFMLPNQNDFHLDHQAAFNASLYALVQASEKILPDFGQSSRRDSVFRYGVWSPFNGNPSHQLKVSKDVLEKKLEALSAFESQREIIEILKRRGNTEYFQEYHVLGYPYEKYRKLF